MNRPKEFTFTVKVRQLVTGACLTRIEVEVGEDESIRLNSTIQDSLIDALTTAAVKIQHWQEVRARFEAGEFKKKGGAL